MMLTMHVRLRNLNKEYRRMLKLDEVAGERPTTIAKVEMSAASWACLIMSIKGVE